MILKVMNRMELLLLFLKKEIINLVHEKDS